jgi:hypothetical protein
MESKVAAAISEKGRSYSNLLRLPNLDAHSINPPNATH